MSMSDYILQKDIEQSDPTTARVCPKDPDHGRLTVHGTGKGLICGCFLGIKNKQAVCCDYVEPLSVG